MGEARTVRFTVEVDADEFTFEELEAMRDCSETMDVDSCGYAWKAFDRAYEVPHTSIVDTGIEVIDREVQGERV